MEERNESRWKQLWNDHKDILISVGLVVIVYRMGYVRGYNASSDAVNAAFKSLADAFDISKL